MWTKICGLTREEDVRVCLDLDIDLIGFIFHPPSPRCVQPGHAAQFPRGGSRRVGVFVRHTAKQIEACIQEAGLDLAQLHGGQDPEICRRIGPERVLKVLWPQKYPHARAMQEDLDRFGPVCSAFVLDSGRSGGGHGRIVSVSWLSELVFPRPWYLAGGLGPQTLPDLLRTCRPDGLDLNSGVEISPGIKDWRLIEKCIRMITS